MAVDLRTLKLPFFKFTLGEKTIENEQQTLKQWQSEVQQILHKLQKILKSANLQLDLDELAVIYSILIPLINTEEWTTDELTNVAIDMLNQLSPPNFEVIELIFLNHIRPLFAKSPHTHIDPNSGRSLRRPAGGLSGSLDFYENQEWKKSPGLSYLIIWCIKSLKTNEYEKIWHLIVPPSMTFLDDYESYYKLKGTEIIKEFIDRVPFELLKRTGIDGLIKTSLNNAILHLHTPETPNILENSVQAFIRLIKLTSPLGSSPQMFDQLCALLGDGIIGGVWMYAYQDLETIEMSLVVCRMIVQELGIGTTRYLKTILQQLIEYLSMSNVSYVRIQIASVELLEDILKVCRPRIHAWNEMILDGVLRCWIFLQGKPNNNKELELENLLIRIVHELITIVPSTKALCNHLLALDEKMFAPLLVQP